MFGTIEKLLKQEQTAEEQIKLTSSTNKKAHKMSHKIYLCKNCGHLYYYRIFKCPLCDSQKIGATSTRNHAVKDVVR